ncbi:hypothetical protein Tco_0490564, partial [Tanacetum coccineum]
MHHHQGYTPPLAQYRSTSSPPLLHPLLVVGRTDSRLPYHLGRDRQESLGKDYGFVATMDREIKRDSEREVGYGITELWDEIVETLQDTDEIYTRLDDEQSQRQLLAVRLNMLFRDRRAHAYTRHLMETEARFSREAWRRSMDVSDLSYGEVMSLRTTILDSVMSDSDESGVTYTERTHTWRSLFRPHPLQITCLEQAPPSADYVPGPEHVDDEIVAADQPYVEDASHTTQSPDYVPESDPEADPEEDDDEDPEEDPVDYPADGGDDGDDEHEPSEEDGDDDVDIEADEDKEEGEEEHPAPANSVVIALPTTDHAPSAEETEPFETDESAATPPPHPAYRVIARISIPA